MTAKILVVDDIDQNLRLLEAKLNSEYYDVILAKNGKQALEVVNEKFNEIDIILLDVMMPELDGFETCKKIKSNQHTSHIPVVMVTALSDIEDRIKGLQAGADDFLTKPIVDIQLFARIRSLVRLKTMIEELKLREQSPAFSEYALSQLTNMNEANILIIDDDEAQTKYLYSVLVDLTKNIKIFSDVKNDDYDRLLTDDLDVIIISTQLVEADGLRICSKIKNHPKAKNIPIILIVEEGENDLLAKGLDIGASDYIFSPLEKTETKLRTLSQIKRKKYQYALKENLRKTMDMASIDQLTGLLNRNGFEKHFLKYRDDHLKYNKDLSVLFLDLDYFKNINDTYGHLTGDSVLKQAAEYFKNTIRATDLAVRFGGEEFVILAPNTNLAQANILAERIRENIETQPFYTEESSKRINLTISIGVTSLRTDDSMESFIERSDKALYESKKSGRNRVTSHITHP